MAKPTAKLDSGYRSAMADRAEVFRIFDLNHPPLKLRYKSRYSATFPIDTE
jgi:hypothetical protein